MGTFQSLETARLRKPGPLPLATSVASWATSMWIPFPLAAAGLASTWSVPLAPPLADDLKIQMIRLQF